MNLFTSKSTRDNMRQLLLAYGKAIIEVIKERQSEINYSSSGADYENRKKNKSYFLFSSIKCIYRRTVVIHFPDALRTVLYYISKFTLKSQ